MHLSLFVLSGLIPLLPFTTATQTCTMTELNPPPSSLICNQKGVLSNEDVISYSLIANPAECATRCYDNGCSSFSVTGTSCAIYRKPLRKMGFKQVKRPTAFWARDCYRKVCTDTPTTTPKPPTSTPKPPTTTPPAPVITACTTPPAQDQQFQLQVGFMGAVVRQDGSNLVYQSLSSPPYFWIDDANNLCQGTQLIYLPNAESTTGPNYGMNLVMGAPKSLPPSARRFQCTKGVWNDVYCYANGQSLKWWYCPDLTSNVLMGAASPNAACQLATLGCTTGYW